MQKISATKENFFTKSNVISHLIILGKIFPFLVMLTSLSTQAQTGSYTVNGGTASQTGQTYSAAVADQSAVYVLNSGKLTLTNCTMSKTGDASNVNNSSQYGINAGILANSGSTVTISGGSVTTNASGANGLFASGSGSSISMTNGTINASGGNAHGVDVTYSGSIILTNVNVTTTGASSSALATDFGGGTVTVSGGTINASSTAANSHSAGIYSTGNITVSGATVSSAGDCGGVIDGSNSIILTNTSLTGAIEGIKIWKTAPASGTATVKITGGSLTTTSGDAFYVTGETGNASTASITSDSGATINTGTGNIMNVISSSTASFTVDADTLTGNMVADATSTLSVILKNGSSLTGNAQHTAMTIDSNSVWIVTANSVLTSLTDTKGISGLTVTNIVGNGQNIHYDSSLVANRYLGGHTYSLVNGGVLTAGSVTDVRGEQTGLPSTYVLYQNYPNPFNPTTTIAIDLAQRSYVTLKVYNLLGQQVVTLINGIREAGRYEIPFVGTNLASGVYFYRLQTSRFVQTKKLLIVK